jgi:hypothetical protein
VLLPLAVLPFLSLSERAGQMVLLSVAAGSAVLGRWQRQRFAALAAQDRRRP